MGGAVNTVLTAAKDATNKVDKVTSDVAGKVFGNFGKSVVGLKSRWGTQDATQHFDAFKNLANGEGLSGFVKPYRERFASVVGEIKGDKPPPVVAVEDPVVVADRAKAEKEKARRQTQTDILTGQPGRGGTILTNDYGYKL